MRHTRQADVEGCPQSPDQACLSPYPVASATSIHTEAATFRRVLELSVLLLCAGTSCISKWVIRTVLREAADGLLAGWIQAVGVDQNSLKKGYTEAQTYRHANYTFAKA